MSPVGEVVGLAGVGLLIWSGMLGGPPVFVGNHIYVELIPAAGYARLDVSAYLASRLYIPSVLAPPKARLVVHVGDQNQKFITRAVCSLRFVGRHTLL